MPVEQKPKQKPISTTRYARIVLKTGIITSDCVESPGNAETGFE